MRVLKASWEITRRCNADCFIAMSMAPTTWGGSTTTMSTLSCGGSSKGECVPDLRRW